VSVECRGPISKEGQRTELLGYDNVLTHILRGDYPSKDRVLRS